MAAILVIEDNALNMKLVRDVLIMSGHTVMCAEDAEEGVELARREMPALILMDLQLPGMNGLEATSALKSNPETAHIPIIALTAFARDEDRLRAQEAGCEGYMTKPIRYRELLVEIEVLLNPKGGRP